MKKAPSVLLVLFVLFFIVTGSESFAQLREKYEKQVSQYEKDQERCPPESDSTFFVGSSTFTRWKTIPEDFKEYKGINRGFGGSQISDWLETADRIVTPWHPKRIIFFCGGNDIKAGKSPEEVLADFQKLLAILRADNPNRPIHYCRLPHPPVQPQTWEKSDIYSEMIRELTKTDPNLYLIDFVDALNDENGVTREDLYGEDRLHLNARGESILRDFIIRSIESERTE